MAQNASPASPIAHIFTVYGVVPKILAGRGQRLPRSSPHPRKDPERLNPGSHAEASALSAKR